MLPGFNNVVVMNDPDYPGDLIEQAAHPSQRNDGVICEQGNSAFELVVVLFAESL